VPASSAGVPALQLPFTPSPDEHWAEVDMGNALVRLYRSYNPVYTFTMSYGRGGDPKTTTFPGVFHVYAKNANLHESIDPGHYIRNWVGFDPKWANGFHSLIMNSAGQIIDDRLGLAISSGCIRTSLPNSEIIYNWLDYGERVWVHT
jgi:lipoprotein-anchoring transpeptidase ErfK/SrfK